MSRYDPYRPRSQAPSLLWPVLLLALLAGVLAWRFWPHHEAVNDPGAMPRPVVARGDLAEDEKTNIKLYREVSPSVVHITTLAERQDFFSLDVQQIPRGTGTGFMWDEDGRV